MHYTKYIFSLTLLFFAVTSVYAQEEEFEGILIADVGVQNASVVYQEGHTLDVFFELVNGEAVQPNIRYAVQVVEATEEGDRIWGEYTPDDVISLASNERLHRNITYTAPAWLDGIYEVRVIVENTAGLPLGSAFLGEVMFSGTGQYVEIDPDSCDVLYDYETPVSLTCLATNYFDTTLDVSPLSEVYRKTTRGEGVGMFWDEAVRYTFGAGETKEVEFVFAPQPGYGTYAAHALLVGAQGADVSNRVPYTYSTYASPAQIENITANASGYDEDDEAVITVAYAADETVFFTLELTDEDGRLCSEPITDVRLAYTESVYTARTIIDRSCEHPTASVFLTAGTGDVVDASTIYLSGLQEETGRLSFRDYMIILAVIVILILAYMLYRHTHKARNTETLTLSVLFVVLAFGFTTHFAEAGSWSSGSSISGCRNSLQGNINKSTYEPGEAIRVSMRTSVSCNSSATVNGVPIGSVGSLKTKMYTNTSGSSDSRTGINGNGYGGRLANGCCWGTTLTAPGRAGSYNTNFRSVNYTQEGTGYSSGRGPAPRRYVSHGSIRGSERYRVVATTPPAPTASLTASPSSIERGDETTLQSRCTNSTSASISRGVGSVSSSTDNTDVSPTQRTTYTLTCSGPGGSDNDSTTVIVTEPPVPAPTASLTASPSSIQEGNSTRLIARCTNSNASSINNGVGSLSATGGRPVVSPNSPTTYRLTCFGEETDAVATTRVRVTATPPPPPAAPHASISASPRRIQEGESTRVHWSSSNAVECRSTSSPLTTGGDTEGTQNITLNRAQTKTFSIVCENSAGDTDSASTQVTVEEPSEPSGPGSSPSPTATLEVRNTTGGGGWTSSNITILPGDQIALRWDSTNASACSGSNFNTGRADDGTTTSVNEPTGGNRTTYAVTCTGSGGSDSDSLRVTAQGLEPDLSISDEDVRQGESVTLTYNMQGNDPSQCSLVGPGVSYIAGSFSQQSGSIAITISGDSTFTLTCPGGFAEATVELIPVIFDS
ncbi:hypothetical protein KTR10_01020 [Candidatus Kaiserbacteria bacterium]|nr:hypothetical protein [Candidatus Kaiserbacteria bacterium]